MESAQFTSLQFPKKYERRNSIPLKFFLRICDVKHMKISKHISNITGLERGTKYFHEKDTLSNNYPLLV